MIQLKKFIILVILLVLNYSISWCQSDILSTGEFNENNSVLISVPAIKAANAKMLELKYQKEINNELNNIIKQDSIIIDNLHNTIYENNVKYNNNIDKVISQRNKTIIISSGTNIVLLVLLIISLI